jgi:hypothetical protein
LNKYKRITLYFKTEDEQDSLRYELIGSLGKGKKTIFDHMIDQYLQTYGISNIEDLTLRDLQLIKKDLMGEEPEAKEKRGRGRPRKNKESVEISCPQIAETKEDSFKNANLKDESVKAEKKENVSVDKENSNTIAKTSADIPSQVEVKSKSPMYVEIEEEDDSLIVGENSLDTALLEELDAFFK